MEYTELDKSVQRSMVMARLESLERQHFELSLRVNSPDLSQPPSEMDGRNLQNLEAGITNLRVMAQELEQSRPTPASE